MNTPEFRQFQKQVTKLADAIVKFEAKNYGIACDDIYEYLAIACSDDMEKKIQDTMKYTVESIRKISAKDETMKQILELFEGNNVREKKEKLKEYLNEHPLFRTTDPKILLQRLKLKDKYGEVFARRPIPQTPIKEAIDELNAQAEQG